MADANSYIIYIYVAINSLVPSPPGIKGIAAVQKVDIMCGGFLIQTTINCVEWKFVKICMEPFPKLTGWDRAQSSTPVSAMG